MGALDSAVVNLKRSLGLPTTPDVKPVAASSAPQRTTQAPQERLTPAQQGTAASNTVAALEKPEAPGASEPSETDKIMAMKDKAIEDLRTRNEASMKAQEELNNKLSAILSAMTPKAQEQQQDMDKLPDVPEIPDGVSAEEAIRLLRESQATMQAKVAETLKKRDEQLKQVVGPLLNEVRQTAQYRDKKELLERYPNFEYEKFKPAMDKLRYELKGLSEVEAARLVATQENRLDMLGVPEVTSPHSEPARSSMGTAGSQPRAPEPPKVDEADVDRRYMGAILDAQASGNRVAANQMIQKLIGRKVTPFWKK